MSVDNDYILELRSNHERHALSAHKERGVEEDELYLSPENRRRVLLTFEERFHCLLQDEKHNCLQRIDLRLITYTSHEASANFLHVMLTSIMTMIRKLRQIRNAPDRRALRKIILELREEVQLKLDALASMTLFQSKKGRIKWLRTDKQLAQLFYELATGQNEDAEGGDKSTKTIGKVVDMSVQLIPDFICSTFLNSKGNEINIGTIRDYIRKPEESFSPDNSFKFPKERPYKKRNVKRVYD